MNVCKHCGTNNRDTAQFCQNCGDFIAREITCTHCGTENPVEANYCIQCAVPLRGGAPPQSLTGMLAADTVLAGRYKIIRKLGRGGMGAVYMVEDARLGNKVWAVKELSTAALPTSEEKEEAIKSFQGEATLLASLNHPNLARVMDYFEDGGKHYLVMDFIDGQTLDEMIAARSEPFPEGEVRDWAVQICDVLGYLHSQPQPIIFRDLKPGNIMIDQNGQVHLIDFGIARFFKPGKGKDTASFGTTGYAPPEQYGRGQTDARSDIYALGATIHQLVTLRDPGDEPFKFPPAQKLNPTLSDEIDDLIAKAVAQEPEKRWASTEELAEALTTPIPVSVQPVLPSQVTPAVVTQPIPREEPVDQEQVTKPEPAWRRRLPGGKSWLVIGIIALLLIALGILYLFDLPPFGAVSQAALPAASSSGYLYTSDREDGKREIYRLDQSGEVVRVTNTPGNAESWSPVTSDSGNILFTSTRAGKREIYRLNKSGELARVTYSPGNSESWSPAVSARGRVLFTSNRDGKREIYRIDVDGKTTRVTNTPGSAESWSPAVSPSGQLLFTSNRDGKSELYRINVDGETIRVTHTPSDGESWSPTLSPGGTILFTSNRDGKREIYRLDDEGNTHRVTSTTRGAESWSPDRTPSGSTLFTSNRVGKPEIYRLESSGKVTRVTNTPGRAGSWTGEDE